MEETDGPGELSGEGVVVVGPFGDQGPQGRIGGKDPVVAVAVDAGRKKDPGQAVQALQGRETQGGAADEVGPREDLEDLVGTAADQVETVEGDGGGFVEGRWCMALR